MIAIDAVYRAILIIKRYGLYLCIPAAFLIASIYIHSTYSQYRVTAKIALKGISSGEAMDALGTKQLVQMALNQLPFQVSYYDVQSPRDEVFGSALKARLVFDQYKYPGNQVWMKLENVGSRFYTLSNQDTTAYYQYGEPVNAFYGKFRVLRQLVADTSETLYLVRLNDPSHVFDEYYSNLKLKAGDDDGSLTISVVSGSAQKGVRLLNKMLQLYGGGSIASSRLAGINTLSLPKARLTILEKPENNIQAASMSPVWIYIIALFGGLLIPVSREVSMRRKKKYVFRLRTFTLPKFAERLQHNVSVNKVVRKESLQ